MRNKYTAKQNKQVALLVKYKKRQNPIYIYTHIHAFKGVRVKGESQDILLSEIYIKNQCSLFRYFIEQKLCL